MNDEELEEDKQEANHEEEVDIYIEDNKNDHEDVDMVEEEENKNNYKMKKNSNVSKTASSAKKGAIIQSSDDDHNLTYSTIFAGNLKKTISENVAKAVQYNSMDVHITGLFSNKTNWQKSLGFGVW
jgi:hypothetical protein